MVHSIWPKNTKIALIRGYSRLIISWPKQPNLLIFSGMIVLNNAIKNIKSGFPGKSGSWIMSLKPAKIARFRDYQMIQIFSREIKPYYFSPLITLYHPVRNLRKLSSGSIITFCDYVINYQPPCFRYMLHWSEYHQN